MRHLLIALTVLATSAVSAQDYSVLLDNPDHLTGASYTGSGFSAVIPLHAGTGPRFVSRQINQPRSGLVSFSFATPDGALIEKVNIVSANLPLGADDSRLEALASLLNGTTVPYLLARFEQGQSTGTRPITVGAHRGVEVLGNYVHPQHGPIQWRLVGLPNPNSADSVYALVQIATRQMPLPAANAYAHSLTGRLLASLRYLP